MNGPFRIQPAMPVQAYRTFAVTAPLSTHFRKATCEEVDCPAFTSGWVTRVQTQEQADYIRRHSGRSFEETEPGVFVFKPGQMCFGASSHRVRLERQEHYLVRSGDWRGNPDGQVRKHTSSEFWVEEFAEHQDWLKTLKERG